MDARRPLEPPDPGALSIRPRTRRPSPCAPDTRPALLPAAPGLPGIGLGSHVLETQLEQRKEELGGRPGVLLLRLSLLVHGSECLRICLMRYPVPQRTDSRIL